MCLHLPALRLTRKWKADARLRRSSRLLASPFNQEKDGLAGLILKNGPASGSGRASGFGTWFDSYYLQDFVVE
jgi:hypothetical protein